MFKKIIILFFCMQLLLSNSLFAGNQENVFYIRLVKPGNICEQEWINTNDCKVRCIFYYEIGCATGWRDAYQRNETMEVIFGPRERKVITFPSGTLLTDLRAVVRLP